MSKNDDLASRYDNQYINPMNIIRDRRSIDPDLLTQLQISELADISRHTVTKWQQRGILPAPVLRVPRWNMPLYNRQEIIDWLVETGRLAIDKGNA